jgi:hypothetical protein
VLWRLQLPGDTKREISAPQVCEERRADYESQHGAATDRKNGSHVSRTNLCAKMTDRERIAETVNIGSLSS